MDNVLLLISCRSISNYRLSFCQRILVANSPQLYSEYCHNGISGLLFLFVFSILLFIASVVVDKLRMRIQGTIEFTLSKVKSIFR